MKVGIDLGTCYSVTARMQPDGSAILIPDARDEERFNTPSVVLISDGSAYIGALAEDMVEVHPNLPIIRFFKRSLGKREEIYFDDRGTGWHAEGIGALILSKLRFDAETESSRKVDGAVITVPAHFNDRQRKAVAAAALLADLPLLDLIEEPVAAALHYGVQTKAHKQILMAYDFGGGTFDATALSLDDNGIYVLAKSGLTDLGGKELDDKVAEMILEQFEGALGTKPDLTAQGLLELRRTSEAIKIDLCTPGSRTVQQTVILGGDAVEVRLDRDQFERAIGEYLDKTIEVTERCLKESGLAKTDINRVLLVGGSSMVPSVSKRLNALFDVEGQDVLYHEPSKAVAFGAAMRAAQVSGEAAGFQLPPELKGVTGYHVGVRTVDPSGLVNVHTLIKKNMPLPTSIQKTYYTTRHDQNQIVLDFVQYADDPEKAFGLGQLVVGPLAAPRVNYPIGVKVEYKEDGTVGVVARDAETGEELEQSFGGDPRGDVSYLADQRKALHSILMTRP